MYRGEQRALEKYPPHSVLIVPARGGGYYADSHLREGFIKGYHQAEKDLELTWEDVREICTQSVLVEIDLGGLVSDERHYTEVLKRFKDYKERKEV